MVPCKRQMWPNITAKLKGIEQQKHDSVPGHTIANQKTRQQAKLKTM